MPASTLRNAIIASSLAFIVFLSSACGGSGQSSQTPPPPAIIVSITPSTTDLVQGATADFTAAVTNTSNQNVTWTIREGSSGGTVTNAGRYTAPANIGTYHVVATSEADHTKSAAATVSVHALPPPAFGSVPPTDASEGSLYTYNISATDPSGEEISFELSGAPTGAALTGSTLTWTPTFDQSRTDNAFTVVAQTPSGRSATQAWIVAPRGSVHGKMLYRHLLENGVSTEPIDFTLASCSIFFKSADGSLVQHDSVGQNDGTFTVPDIPAGYYWFVLWSWQPGWSWDPVWTDTKSLDMSVSFLGRSATPDNARLRQYSVSGLTPAGQDDIVGWWVPNVNEASSWILPPGDSQFNSLILASHWLDASQGDKAWVTQLVSESAAGVSYQAVSKSLGPLKLTDSATGPAPVIGAMSDVARDQTIRASVAMSKFSLLLAGSQGAGLSPAYLSVNAHPYGIAEGALADPSATQHLMMATLPSAVTPPTSDVDLGTISFGNPFPATWTQLVAYQQFFSVARQFPGMTHLAGFGSAVSQTTDQFPTADKPLEPLLNPITNLRIDGQDFFQPATISSTPTLSWDLPANKAPNGYFINLYEISGANDNTIVNWVQGFRTGAHEVWFPPGTVQPGHSYVFMLRAVYEGGRDFGTTPFLNGFPRAATGYISAIVVVATTGSSTSAPTVLVRGGESNRKLQMRAIRLSSDK